MNKLTIHLYSFGYQMSGIPNDQTDNNGGFVFDCRFLPNPGREPEYVCSTGKDDDVIRYFQNYPVVQKFIDTTKTIINMVIENYSERGFTNLMISFGCTGGQHRSVYCAEQMYQYLKSKSVNVNLHHVELEK